jgi:hypothetical protein
VSFIFPASNAEFSGDFEAIAFLLYAAPSSLSFFSLPSLKEGKGGDSHLQTKRRKAIWKARETVPTSDTMIHGLYLDQLLGLYDPL